MALHKLNLWEEMAILFLNRIPLISALNLTQYFQKLRPLHPILSYALKDAYA